VAQHRRRPLFDRAIVRAAIVDSFRKLDPRRQARNPVMFVVLVGAAIVTVLLVRDVAAADRGDAFFNLQIALWLWFTVLFANFAEAMAEGRGKAQADALARTRTETVARRLKKRTSARHGNLPAQCETWTQVFRLLVWQRRHEHPEIVYLANGAPLPLHPALAAHLKYVG